MSRARWESAMLMAAARSGARAAGTPPKEKRRPTRPPPLLQCAFSTSATGPAKAGHYLEARRLAKRVGAVCPLPREALFGAPEVSEGGGLSVNRPPQIEIVDDAFRRQLEVFAHEVGHLRVGDFPGAEGFDHDRDRIGDADRIGELHLKLFREAGGHQVLRDVACHVASRAVDLRGILS